MTRERLPGRRPNETTDLELGGARYAVTIGFYPDGRPGEVFTAGAKVGSPTCWPRNRRHHEPGLLAE